MDTLQTAEPGDVGLNAARLARIPALVRGYLERRAFAGCAVLVARRGKVAYQHQAGVLDWDTGVPVTADTLYRIYSMTKPVTSVALMMLYEEGRIRLEHEVSRYIPEFADLRVFASGTVDDYSTRRPQRPMRVHDLLTHTSGLTYSFLFQHPVDALYRKSRIGLAKEDGYTLQQMVARVAELPLVCSPGERWNYSISTDVCGRLVEIVSGQSLDAFFAERIFTPLRMRDTAFSVAPGQLARFASCYERNPKTGEIRKHDDAAHSSFSGPCSLYSGGGGLVSSLPDYYRFCTMLLNGGALDGERLLSPRTVAYMTRNHLARNGTLLEMGDSLFSEARMDGSGFGLGFATVVDPVRQLAVISPGTYSWGGMASTYFWIDPVEELVGIVMTQLMPSSSYPLRSQLQTLVYAAIVD